MKKLSVIALAVAACMLFAIPAMAVDVDFSGHYRVRGFYEDNTTLDDDDSSDAAMDMRLRIEPVIKIHDRLKVTMRFDGMDNRLWGTDEYKNTGAGKEDFGLERVFMDVDFDMIGLRIGRMVAGTCGLKFCDNETEQDRIKVILKNIDPFYLDFTYAKHIESDYYDPNVGAEEDGDFDMYWLHGFRSDETMTYGLLFGFYNNKTNDDYSQQYWLFDPYFKGNFGPFTVEAEAQWMTGDYRDFNAAGQQDIDYDAWRYILDVSFNFGPGAVGVGYAHSDGDNDPNDDEYNAAGLGGNDWEPLLILTGFTANSDLGGTGLGNLNSSNASTEINNAGFDIYYLYGNYAVTESVTLNAILGFAYADETPAGVDDEYGWEFDIGAKWQIMDNLAYDIKAGYFSPGDLYKDVIGTDDETWSVMHSLVVTF